MAQDTEATTLETLPAELITHILEDVHEHDLAALRLTCKSINASATPLFDKAFFEHRSHILSLYSIRGLVDISDHPIFGACVRTISLGRYPSPTRDSAI